MFKICGLSRGMSHLKIIAGFAPAVSSISEHYRCLNSQNLDCMYRLPLRLPPSRAVQEALQCAARYLSFLLVTSEECQVSRARVAVVVTHSAHTVWIIEHSGVGRRGERRCRDIPIKHTLDS